MRARQVVIGGLPYFGRMLAELLRGPNWQVDYLESAERRPSAWLKTAAAVGRADLVYLIGGQIERWSRPDWLTRVVRCPIVIHWVGSDVTYALEVASRNRASRLLIRRPTHWAEVEWTAAELRPAGIDATVVPLTSLRLLSKHSALPERFAVLCYLPDSRPEFYGRTAIYSLAESMPDVHFLVAGGTRTDQRAPANIEFLGWVADVAAVYARSTVLLRMAQHDGLSFMVIEALAAGRYVIWNHRTEGAIEAYDTVQALNALLLLRERHRAGQLEPNTQGRRAVMQLYNPERVRDEILGRFESLLTAQRRS